MDVSWEATSGEWKRAAERAGHAWLGLVSEPSYQSLTQGQAIAPAPVLKLKLVAT
ncbi:hypothetical protein [Streptomyces cucumeris]|uniref:hypothetical protein n=1 Tax=Streptomyces cucumeris TaxID=2962890 RepID=UPI0020C88811|nr:hypothetical protein [Streptomyces sp. NEAU-Y11]MCP9209648.1 hypothetical protein [Streptomyces sp. NEAU-Y11]